MRRTTILAVCALWHLFFAVNSRAYFDPEVGRYLSRDPIGYSDGMNVYAYVGNNPINHVDPLGLANWQGEGGEGQFQYFPKGPFSYHAADTLHEQLLANLGNMFPLALNSGFALLQKMDETLGPAGNFALAGVTSAPQEILAAQRSAAVLTELATVKTEAALASIGPKLEALMDAAKAKLPGTAEILGRRLQSETGAIDIGGGETLRNGAKVARQRGVARFWSEEADRIRQGRPSRKWTPEQENAILNGEVPKSAVDTKSVEGAHVKSVQQHPEIADDPANIRAKSFTEHRKKDSGEHSTNPKDWEITPNTTP